MNNDENISNTATVDEPDIPQNIKIKPLIYFSDFGAEFIFLSVSCRFLFFSLYSKSVSVSKD